MGLIVEDGEPGHLLAMCGAAAPGLRLSLPRPLYNYLTAQVAVSRSLALFEDGEAASPFCLFGATSFDDGSVEVWFIVRPGGLPAQLLLALVRLSRSRLDALAVPAICLVRAENENGKRLARLCGFSLSGETYGEAQIWRRSA